MTILEIVFWVALALIAALWLFGLRKAEGSSPPAWKSGAIGVLFLIAVLVLGVVVFHVRLT